MTPLARPPWEGKSCEWPFCKDSADCVSGVRVYCYTHGCNVETNRKNILQFVRERQLAS